MTEELSKRSCVKEQQYGGGGYCTVVKALAPLQWQSPPVLVDFSFFFTTLLMCKLALYKSVSTDWLTTNHALDLNTTAIIIK